MKKFLFIALAAITSSISGCKTETDVQSRLAVETSVTEDMYSTNAADTEASSEQHEVYREDENNMININIKIDNEVFAAKLYDNKTTREIVKNFPMTCNMSELNGNEKYYYTDTSYPTNSRRMGRINAGDIMLYGNNCIVVFYESFNTSYSYTPLGHIDNSEGLASAVGNGSVTVSFTK